MPLIKGPQRQQAGITGDLATRKISSNGSVSVEGKGKLWYITRCHVLGLLTAAGDKERAVAVKVHQLLTSLGQEVCA